MKNCKACDKLFERIKNESICSDECRKNQRCKVLQNYFEKKIKNILFCQILKKMMKMKFLKLLLNMKTTILQIMAEYSV